ncbi:MAG TPA: hypothetical protein VGK17_15000 [Propionicimonas sp.]|jgi:hypothetical protein
MDWVEFWTGVSAVGTLAAAAAVIAFWRIDHENAARAQARRVVAAISDWYSLSTEDQARGAAMLRSEGDAYVLVRNHADSPIFDVAVEPLHVTTQPLTTHDVLLPGDRLVMLIGGGVLPQAKNTSTRLRLVFTLDGIAWQREGSSLTRVDPLGWWGRMLGR